MSDSTTIDQTDFLKQLAAQMQSADALVVPPGVDTALTTSAAFAAPPALAPVVVQATSADTVPPTVVDQSDPNVILIENLSRAWLRAVPPDSTLLQYAQLLDDGTLSPDGLEMSFASSAMNSTIPALIISNVMNGVSPPNLDALSAEATQLEDNGAGLPLHNIYITMSAQIVVNSPYAAHWSAETPTQFVSEMYQQIFGMQPWDSAMAWLVHDVAAYAAEFGSDLAGKGATIGGMLALKTQANYIAGPDYLAAADAALHSAAHGGIGLDVFGKVAAWHSDAPGSPVQVANDGRTMG